MPEDTNQPYRDAGASNVVQFPQTETLSPQPADDAEARGAFIAPGTVSTPNWLLWGLVALGLFLLFSDGGSFSFNSEEE